MSQLKKNSKGQESGVDTEDYNPSNNSALQKKTSQEKIKKQLRPNSIRQCWYYRNKELSNIKFKETSQEGWTKRTFHLGET